MANIPMDLNQFGRLARHDLQRAFFHILDVSAASLAEVIEALHKASPPEWPPDLLPALEWLNAAIEAEGAGWLPEVLVPQLLLPESVAASPIQLVRKILGPGDEIPEDLVRRLGAARVSVTGEGERLIAIDRVVLLAGRELGYVHTVTLPIAARRVTVREQELVHRCGALLKLALELYGPDDARTRQLKLRFDRLLTSPNQNMPSTLSRLHALTYRQRAHIWQEIVEYQRRCALPVERRPPFAALLDRLPKGSPGLDSVHVTRLLGLASQLYQRIRPTPESELSFLQTTRRELEEYLRWEPHGAVLSGCRSEAGLRLVNQALLQLALSERGADWPEGLDAELQAFQHGFLRCLYARPIDHLLALDPAELIRGGLERNAELLWPELGDPKRLARRWAELESEIQARLEDVPRHWDPLEPADPVPVPFEPELGGEAAEGAELNGTEDRDEVEAARSDESISVRIGYAVHAEPRSQVNEPQGLELAGPVPMPGDEDDERTVVEPSQGRSIRSGADGHAPPLRFDRRTLLEPTPRSEAAANPTKPGLKPSKSPVEGLPRELFRASLEGHPPWEAAETGVDDSSSGRLDPPGGHSVPRSGEQRQAAPIAAWTAGVSGAVTVGGGNAPHSLEVERQLELLGMVKALERAVEELEQGEERKEGVAELSQAGGRTFKAWLLARHPTDND